MTFRIETGRLVLRELTLDDTDALAEVLGDPVSMRYYPRPFSRDEVVAWIERQLGFYGELGHGLWAVVRKDTGEMIGDAGPTPQQPLGEPEIELGWHIHPAHQRQGFASEAGAAVRDWAWSNLAVPRLISMIRPENIPSQGVASKIGMRRGQEFYYKEILHELWSIDRPPR